MSAEILLEHIASSLAVRSPSLAEFTPPLEAGLFVSQDELKKASDILEATI